MSHAVCHGGSHAVCHAVTHAPVTAVVTVPPTRPDPTRPEKTFHSPRSQDQKLRNARVPIGLDR